MQTKSSKATADEATVLAWARILDRAINDVLGRDRR
jgi:hypothetical protein